MGLIAPAKPHYLCPTRRAICRQLRTRTYRYGTQYVWAGAPRSPTLGSKIPLSEKINPPNFFAWMERACSPGHTAHHIFANRPKLTEIWALKVKQSCSQCAAANYCYCPHYCPHYPQWQQPPHHQALCQGSLSLPRSPFMISVGR